VPPSAGASRHRSAATSRSMPSSKRSGPALPARGLFTIATAGCNTYRFGAPSAIEASVGSKGGASARATPAGRSPSRRPDGAGGGVTHLQAPPWHSVVAARSRASYRQATGRAPYLSLRPTAAGSSENPVVTAQQPLESPGKVGASAAVAPTFRRVDASFRARYGRGLDDQHL
jgi:hypothetical protein